MVPSQHRDGLFECLDAKMEIRLNRLHDRNTKKRDKHLRVVINIYFNHKRKLSSESVMKDKAKTEKKKKNNNSK